MRLLFIIPYTPDPIRVRPYNLIRSLARRGHQITLATLWTNQKERIFLWKLEEGGIRVIAARLPFARSAWNCIRNLPRPTPLQSVYSWEPQLLRLIQAAIVNPESHFDLIHVEHLRGARYGTHLGSPSRSPNIPWLGTLNRLGSPVRVGGLSFAIPMIWDSVDCISHLFQQSANSSCSPFSRLVTRLELTRTRWYEAWLVGRFDRVLVTSEEDRRAFIGLLQQFGPLSDTCLNGMNEITVLPNGVDLDSYMPPHLPRSSQTLAFTGKMSYHANVSAALYLVNEIMPLVWERFPEARVQIVGQNPPREVTDLARRYRGRVIVTGTVVDLRPYLAQATLAVAPLVYCAGIQNKVLEAMAMATPVVASTRAVTALSVLNEREVLLGDDPEMFSEQVIRMLRNQALRERLGGNGRRYVELNHNWSSIASQLESIYQDVAGKAVRNGFII